MSGLENVYTLDLVNFTAGNLYKENQKRKSSMYINGTYAVIATNWKQVSSRGNG